MTRSVTAVGVPQSTAQHLRFLGKYVCHLKDEKICALYNSLTEPMPSPCQILYSTQSAGHWVTAGGSHWQLCYLLNNNGEFYLGNIAHLKSRIPWNALKVLFHPFKLYQFGKFASRRMWISVSFTTSQSPHFPILQTVQHLLDYITFSLEGEFRNTFTRKYQRISIIHLHGQHRGKSLFRKCVCSLCLMKCSKSEK